MEIIEASINSLNNPSLISRILSIFELEMLSLAHGLWKWGAIFLALIYAISSLTYKIKILVLQYRNKSKSLRASDPLLSHVDGEFSSEEDDVVCSSSSSCSSDDEEVEEPTSSYEDLTQFDDDFRVKGSTSESPFQKRKFKLRQRRSFVDNLSSTELVNGDGIVKFWDGFGLGVNINSSSALADIPAVEISPAVVISASAGDDGNLTLGLWDFRTGRRSSVHRTEWQSGRRVGAVGIDVGLTGKVYLSDDVLVRLAVGDVRKLDTPLENPTECEEDTNTWWDANAGTVMDNSTNEFAE